MTDGTVSNILKPNVALLTFITIPETSNEEILLLYLKEVNGLALGLPYWYEDYGKAVLPSRFLAGIMNKYKKLNSFRSKWAIHA